MMNDMTTAGFAVLLCSPWLLAFLKGVVLHGRRHLFHELRAGRKVERAHAVLGIPLDVFSTAALDDQFRQRRAGCGWERETGKTPGGQSFNRCTCVRSCGRARSLQRPYLALKYS